MPQILSLSMRPKTLDEMIGFGKLVNSLRGHNRSGRLPQAWLFAGQTGGGKTTLARILALSLQCQHQEKFGNPCEQCRKGRSEFDIMEINASEISGVDDMKRITESSMYAPRLPSKRRVYILDEAQRISSAGQNLLLKYFEDCPRSSVWIICTTDPQKILKPLRGRCVYYRIPELDSKGVMDLVYKAFESVGKDPEKSGADDLADQLLENRIVSPRLVLMAVEKMLAGADVKIAAQVELEAAVDTLKVCRLVVRGDWKGLSPVLKDVSADDALSIVLSLSGYLTSVVLQPKLSKQGQVAADAIKELGRIVYADEAARKSLTIATLYDLSGKFAGMKGFEIRAEVEKDEDDDDD